MKLSKLLTESPPDLDGEKYCTDSKGNKKKVRYCGAEIDIDQTRMDQSPMNNVFLPFSERQVGDKWEENCNSCACDKNRGSVCTKRDCIENMLEEADK